MSRQWIIGEEVVANNEHGRIEKTDDKGVWVFRTIKGFSSCFAPHNVRPIAEALAERG